MLLFRDFIYLDVDRIQSIIGPLTREHLREDVRSLIYKHGSNPKGEWTMLAEISRVPVSKGSLDDLMQQISDASQQTEANQQAEDVEEPDTQQPLSDVVNPAIEVFNSLQELLSSPSYPEVSVSPVAVYREVPPH